jgi:hypothetical protein
MANGVAQETLVLPLHLSVQYRRTRKVTPPHVRRATAFQLKSSCTRPR